METYGSPEDAFKVVKAYLVQDINDIIHGSNKTATEKLEEISKLPVSLLITFVTRQCLGNYSIDTAEPNH